MYARVTKQDFYDDEAIIEVVEKMSILQATCVVTCREEAFQSYTETYRKLVETLRETDLYADGRVLLVSSCKGLAQIIELDMLDDEITAWTADIPTPEECKESGDETLIGASLMVDDIATFSHERIYDFYDYYKARIPENGGGYYKIMNDINAVKSAFEVFEQIKSTTSNNEKIEIIRSNSDNMLFTKILRFVYDDFITTGVSFKSICTRIDGLDDFVTEPGQYTMETLMNHVRAYNTGTISTIQKIIDYASVFEDQALREFIYHVFAKDLKVGVTAKSINKALGKGFIREFSVQLAHPFHKYVNKVEGKHFTLTQKLDGHRAVCIVKDGRPKFYTRKGLPIDGMEVQEQEVLHLADDDPLEFVLDGELLLPNTDGLATKDLFRETSKVLRSKSKDKSDIIFNVFDVVSYDEFVAGTSLDGFSARKQNLYGAFSDHPNLKHLKLVQDLYIGNDLSMIYELQRTMVKPNGWEGLMLNLNNGKYQTKRTTNLLKIKEFLDADVYVKDVFEGTGRLAGKLGGVVIDYKGNDVKVGSGFSDGERDVFWKDPSTIVGHLIQVSYFEETHNQNDDKLSLRFPTFVTVRDDKSEPSYEI